MRKEPSGGQSYRSIGRDTGMNISSIVMNLLEPKRLLQQYYLRSKSTSFSKKVRWDAVPKTSYAYCTYLAALQAKALGISEISVMEFGVAGGNGLVALESIAAAVEDEIGVSVRCYGFDTGSGMPKPRGYRDEPYIYQQGYFKMDVEALRARLSTASLILGDVAETVPEFCENEKYPPVGFIAIDVDYYTATVDVLKLLSQDPDKFIPRVFCYLDDIVGDDMELHCDYVGELLAVNEFNEAHSDRKIGKIYGLTHKRLFPEAWNDQIFVCHLFTHPLYNEFVYSEDHWDVSLEDAAETQKARDRLNIG